MNNKSIFFLKKIKKKCVKMHVLKNTKILDAAKSPHLFFFFFFFWGGGGGGGFKT